MPDDTNFSAHDIYGGGVWRERPKSKTSLCLF